MDAVSTRVLTLNGGSSSVKYGVYAVGEAVVENVMWSYEEPFADAHRIKGYAAFYIDELDVIESGGDRREIKREELEGAPANPLVDWLLRKAPAARSGLTWSSPSKR